MIECILWFIGISELINLGFTAYPITDAFWVALEGTNSTYGILKSCTPKCASFESKKA